MFSLELDDSFVKPSGNLWFLSGHQKCKTPAVLGMYRPVRRTLTIPDNMLKELEFVTHGTKFNEALARCRVDNIQGMVHRIREKEKKTNKWYTA